MDVTLFYRFFLGGIMIALYMVTSGISLRLHRSDIPKLAAMGVFYALSSEFLFQGYDLMSVGIASTLIYTYPIIIAVVLYFGFGEQIPAAAKLSVILATAGVFCMSWEGSSMEFNLYGMIIVMLGALAYALYMLMVNRGNLKVRGVTLTCYSLLFSSVFYAIKTIATGQSFHLPSAYWLGFIGSFSLVTTVVSVLAMVIAIRLIDSTPTAVLGALEPVVAVWIAVILFGEAVTWNLVAGVVLIISALLVNILGSRIRTLKSKYL